MGTVQFIHRMVEDAVVSGELTEDQRRGVEDLFLAVLNGLARFANLIGDCDRHAGAVEACKRMVAGTLVAHRAPPRRRADDQPD